MERRGVVCRCPLVAAVVLSCTLSSLYWGLSLAIRAPSRARRRSAVGGLGPLFRQDEASTVACDELERPNLEPGDTVNGVVTAVESEEVHVDVGAAVPGILRRGHVLGWASPGEHVAVGDTLALTVLSVAADRILVRQTEDRTNLCRTCGEVVHRKRMFGSKGHHCRCARAWRLGDDIPPLFALGDSCFHCMVGPVPPKVKRQVQGLLDQAAPYWTRSSRPHQKGKLFAIGGCLSSKAYFPGTGNLKGPATEILGSMLSSPVARRFLAAKRPDAAQGYTPTPLPSVSPGVGLRGDDGVVLNAYVGLNYMHVRTKSACHAPPEPVARLLGVPSCKETCRACRRSCLTCDECCVHVDDDLSTSLLLGLQEDYPPVDKTAFFVMGDKAFPLAGGRAFVFDGEVVPHGVWCPRGEYVGMAFVRKGLKNFYQVATQHPLEKNWVRPPGPWPKRGEVWRFNGRLSGVNVYNDQLLHKLRDSLGCKGGPVDKDGKRFRSVDILDSSEKGPFVKIRGTYKMRWLEGWIKATDDAGMLVFDKQVLG